MRIYMVMTVLAPIGGIEAALIPLSQELKAGGHEVIVSVIEPVSLPNQNVDALNHIEIIQPRPWFFRAVRFGIRYKSSLLRFISMLAIPGLLLTSGGTLRDAARKFRKKLSQRLDFEALYYRRLLSAIHHKPPDIVHVHGWGCGEDPPAALRILHPFSFPIVYTEHGSLDPERTAPIPNAPVNLADVLIAVSRAAKEGLITVGQTKRRIVVIPYGVCALPDPAQESSASNKEFVIACVARFHPQKGHNDLIAAMAQVVRAIPHARLLLAGEGPLREELQSKVKDLNLKDSVQFLGIVPRSQLPALYARTNVVALVSYWEGLPVSIIEAMSAGKAIVASNVGGNPELVAEGVNGLLVPPGDVPALGQALMDLARNPDRVRRMGESSRQRFEAGEFSPRKVMQATVEAYGLAVEETTEGRTVQLSSYLK